VSTTPSPGLDLDDVRRPGCPQPAGDHRPGRRHDAGLQFTGQALTQTEATEPSFKAVVARTAGAQHTKGTPS